MQIAVLEILFDLQNFKKYTIDCLANKDMFLLALPVESMRVPWVQNILPKNESPKKNNNI